MAKKQPATRITTSASRSRPARRPSAAKSRARRPPTRTPTIHLAAASRKKRADLAADVNRVLRKHGVTGRLTELHVTAATGAAARAAIPAAVAAPPCGPGQVRRVVCFFRKGTFVCEERCV